MYLFLTICLYVQSGDNEMIDGFQVGVEGMWLKLNLDNTTNYVKHYFFTLIAHSVVSNLLPTLLPGMHVGDRRRLIIPPSMGHVLPLKTINSSRCGLVLKIQLLVVQVAAEVHLCLLLVYYGAVLENMGTARMYHLTHG